MKKIVVMIPMLLLLAGCAAFPYNHEIESTVLMRTLGVDVGTQSVDGVAVTASSGARAGAGTQEAQPPTVLSAQADTISAACQRMQSFGEQFIFYGDVEQLLVGQGQAERSLTAVLTHMGRDRELRLEAQVWCVKGGAAADVLFADPEGEGGGAPDRLEAMREDAGLFSAGFPKTAREALVELSGNGCTFVPALALTASRPGDGSGGASAIVPAGYALFRDGALVGYTDPEASRGVNLLLGQVDTDILELVTPGCSRVALKVSGARVRYAPQVEDGVLTGLTVTCNIEADVAERRGNCILNEETLLWLERALAETTRARMAAAAGQLQALGADCLNLEGRAALAAPWHKAAIGAQWEDVFAALPIQIEVKANIARG